MNTLFKVVKSAEKYEEVRRQRVEENLKRMEQLNLPLLKQALHKIHSPKTTPMKRTKPRTFRTELVPVRRSSRFTNKPTPEYKEIVVYERVQLPRRLSVRPRMDLFNRVYASDEGRAKATLKAEEVEASLGSVYPSFVKPMTQSHVTGGFWLGLPSHFCKTYLPKKDDTVKLVDENGEEWLTVYLFRKNGLSGGWKKFACDHDLVDGDAVVFQLIRPTVFKVYIVRVSSFEKGSDLKVKVHDDEQEVKNADD